MEKYALITMGTVKGYTAKEATIDGRKYLVVPVTMMVEGVHSGSHGPLLHTISELGKYPESWNGIPITIDHPKVDDENVSANSPEILEARSVGRVFHTKVKGKKLCAQAYLDEEKLRQISPDVLSAVQNSQPIEVSVGVFSDEEESEGEFHGEEYNAIAYNHRPDHLALLPGGVGACSIEKGCGIRANNANKTQKGVNDEMIRTDKYVKLLTEVKVQGYTLGDILDNTSDGLMTRLEAVRRKIDSLDSNDSYHFVHEVYDDAVVYESRLRVGESKIYKQPYTFNSGVVEFSGDPVEVHKKVEYVAVVKNNQFNFVRTKKPLEVNMDKPKCTPCVEKKVNDLIANGQATDADREVLQAMSETQLDRLFPKKEEAPAPARPAVNAESKEKEKPSIEALSAEDKEALAFGKKQLTARRKQFSEGIQANTSKETWPDAILNNMDIDMLERVYNSTKKAEENIEVNDFSFQASVKKSAIVDNSEVAPMAPAGVTFKEN